MYHSTQNSGPRVILLHAESSNSRISLIAQVLAVSLRIVGEKVLLVSDSPQEEAVMTSARPSRLNSAEFNRIYRERKAEWRRLSQRYDFILLDSIDGCDTLIDDFILVLPDESRELLRSFGFFSRNLHHYLERPLYLLMNRTEADVTDPENKETPLDVFTNLTRQWFGVSPPCLGMLSGLHTDAEGKSIPAENADAFVEVLREAAVFLRSSRLPLISWQYHYSSQRKSDIMDINN